MKTFEEIFKKFLKKIEPSKEDLDFIDSYLKKFIKTLENAIKKKK
jgi:predicted KAP-like P-loop ATPase